MSTNGVIKNSCTNAIVEVRDLLSSDSPRSVVTERIDKLLRSGTLNASFEQLRGSPAFWATLKGSLWAYLSHFGPCQLFLTMSVADLIDPLIFMQIDSTLTFEDARGLSSRIRANLLAANPVAATTIFHRRVESVLNNFLFGETRPFGAIEA